MSRFIFEIFLGFGNDFQRDLEIISRKSLHVISLSIEGIYLKTLLSTEIVKNQNSLNDQPLILNQAHPLLQK